MDWDDADRDGLLRWYFGGEPPDTEPGLPSAEPVPQGERAALAAMPRASRIRVPPALAPVLAPVLAPAPVPVRQSEPQLS